MKPPEKTGWLCGQRENARESQGFRADPVRAEIQICPFAFRITTAAHRFDFPAGFEIFFAADPPWRPLERGWE
jgi:hypothetical protein